MTPTMTVLGLDVSLTSTGWARLDYESGRLVDCGTITTNVTDSLATRVHSIHTFIHALIEPSDDVAIEEGISHRNGKITRQLAAAWGAAATAVVRCGRDPYPVNINTAKKVGTGNGNADKAAVVTAAWHRWGDRVLEPDIADACWVAETLRLHLHSQFPDLDDVLEAPA